MADDVKIENGDFGAALVGTYTGADAKRTITTGLTSPTPDIGAAQQQEAVSYNRTATLRSKRQALTPLPGGRRVDANRYMRARYTMRQEADLLGAPEKMLKDDWKREHQRWTYQWPIRMANSTASFIRSGWFVPVPYDALNEDDPCAAVADITTPGGRWIIWKSHILVAVPPEKHDLLVTQYEDYAIARTASNAEYVAEALERANPGFAAEIEPFSHMRDSKTGD